MIALLFGLLGGIGLFLLGMTLLTDGLKSFAGDNLRLALLKYTDKPTKAFSCGALVTALVQSSSATTLTVIGFVSAGLLTFTPAVSVVIGASLGTTSTGWLVSVLGLKVSIGFYALPLIGIGAFMRLFSHGRWRSLGFAIAGFGLIFVGIETLQRSMEGLSGFIALSEIHLTGLTGYILGMVIGFAMTVIMQSSSAAVATTLTALHTESITFDQAASVVIGAAIGTTVKGVLASIGASIPAKRTALAHILFNTATGIIAIILLPLFLILIEAGQNHFGLVPGPMSLAAFHTLFIGVGVLVFMPFVSRFSDLIERMLPETDITFTRNLDESLLSIPVIALDTVGRTLTAIALEIITIARNNMNQYHSYVLNEQRIYRVYQELRTTHEFFVKIPAADEDQSLSVIRVSLIHAIDHMLRMEEYMYPENRIRRMFTHKETVDVLDKCHAIMNIADDSLSQPENKKVEELEMLSSDLISLGDQRRAEIIHRTAEGELNAQNATELLDTIRWIVRTGNHIARICIYLGRDNSVHDDKVTDEE